MRAAASSRAAARAFNVFEIHFSSNLNSHERIKIGKSERKCIGYVQQCKSMPISSRFASADCLCAVSRTLRQTDLTEWVAGIVDLSQVACANGVIRNACDLGRMPSLGVSSLDLGPPSQAALLFPGPQREATKSSRGKGNNTDPSGRVGYASARDSS